MKQTVQLKLEDVKFFKKNKAGTLVCLPTNAPTSLVLTADSATLKLCQTPTSSIPNYTW